MILKNSEDKVFSKMDSENESPKKQFKEFFDKDRSNKIENISEPKSKKGGDIDGITRKGKSSQRKFILPDNQFENDNYEYEQPVGLMIDEKENVDESKPSELEENEELKEQAKEFFSKAAKDEKTTSENVPKKTIPFEQSLKP